MLKFMIGLGFIVNFTEAFGAEEGDVAGPGGTPCIPNIALDGTLFCKQPIIGLDDSDESFPGSDDAVLDGGTGEEAEDLFVDSVEPIDPWDNPYSDDAGDPAADIFWEPTVQSMTMSQFLGAPAPVAVDPEMLAQAQQYLVRVVAPYGRSRQVIQALKPQQKIDLFNVLQALLLEFPEEDPMGIIKPWVVQNCLNLLGGNLMGLSDFLSVFKFFAPTALSSIKRVQIMEALVNAVNAGVDLSAIDPEMDPDNLIKTINQFTQATITRSVGEDD